MRTLAAAGVAAVVVALAGCGGDDDPDRALAPPVTATNATALGCAEGNAIGLDLGAGTGDVLADTRALLEDELDQFDVVERVDERTTRVVRGGRVVAVVHFRDGRPASLDVCAFLTQ